MILCCKWTVIKKWFLLTAESTCSWYKILWVSFPAHIPWGMLKMPLCLKENKPYESRARMWQILTVIYFPMKSICKITIMMSQHQFLLGVIVKYTKRIAQWTHTDHPDWTIIRILSHQFHLSFLLSLLKYFKANPWSHWYASRKMWTLS